MAANLDLDALNELKQVMGDEFPLLIDTFVNDSVVRIETIREAVVSGDPEAIRRTAHSFKGSASNMGAPVLTEHCRKLEELGNSGQVEGSLAVFDALVIEYESVHIALQAL